MRLEITERLCPFSHLPGTSFVLPLSSLNLEVFPSLIRINDLNAPLPRFLADIALHVEGPVDDFTTIQDLEKGVLRVFGKSATGYFRYSIKAREVDQGIVVFVEKAPPEGLAFKCKGQWISSQKEVGSQEVGRWSLVKAGEEITFGGKDSSEKDIHLDSLPLLEKLFLGSHKHQDWELVQRRLSFTEIFPVWYSLGQVVSQSFSNRLVGTALLLNECKHAIAANAPDKILDKFKKLFLSSFDGVLSPRLIDTNFQGIKYQGSDLTINPTEEASSLTLLVEGMKLIRSLFVQVTDETLHILPQLPPEFFCGQMIDIKCGKQGFLSIEWTKKSIRRMTFSALQNQKIAFTFSNHEKKCRVRSSFKDKGIVYVPSSQIDIIAGQNYWFDNFQR